MLNIIDPEEVVLLLPEINQKQVVPLYGCYVQAGFPSPADDFLEKKIDLNEFLIQNKSSTFLVRVSGESMSGVGIYEGNILIVDRSVTPKHNQIVVGSLNGEFTVKRLIKEGKRIILQPENPDYKPIEITKESNLKIWGVVTFAIQNF
ncbi:LexA family protein [Chondrinema litorale]|uniref:LexA family protein n=1 Tax=Chondrinema litorale TaxID=2994555 RepID=UPI0025435DDE|nr:translesion error-prone DNA polymerase V autoproteolytic subunit [Chondrinema litorale]UZR95202.1 translesion error-prone DNA polymerase V autoproteolytic subunit [Chondrinema litorale]